MGMLTLLMDDSGLYGARVAVTRSLRVSPSRGLAGENLPVLSFGTTKMQQGRHSIRIGRTALLAAASLAFAMAASAQAPAGGPVGGVLESLLAEGQHPYVTAV